jgi:Barstar (barnase inhibitor)
VHFASPARRPFDPTSAQTNRLKGPGSSYDAAGNLKTWNGAAYEYNRFNQMSRMNSGGAKMNITLLYSPVPPWIVIHKLDPEHTNLLPTYYYMREGFSPEIKMLRGKKMRTLEGLMNEFGAALQFFSEFGENWHALEECLSYMDEWMPADAYILEISSPEEVLIDDQEELTWFLRVLNDVGEWWSKPVEGNGRFDRKAIPFHVVLRCDESNLLETVKRFPGVPLLISDEA